MNTIEQTRQELLSIISDMYKDAHGVRPHGLYSNFSVDDLRQECLVLQVAVERAIQEEEEYKDRMVKQFESDITLSMRYGAKTREDAIRWILVANEFDDYDLHDADYLAYSLGLPYSYAQELRPAAQKIVAEVA